MSTQFISLVTSMYGMFSHGNPESNAKFAFRQLKTLRESTSTVTVFYFPEREVTVGINWNPEHNTVQIATAVMSRDAGETYCQFVGEFLVRCRIEDGAYVLARKPDSIEELESLAGMVAVTIC